MSGYALVAILTGIGLASICAGGLSLAGAAGMWLLMPETLQRRRSPIANRPAAPAEGPMEVVGPA